MTDQPCAPFVYVDANPFIYAVEGNDALASPINELFSRLRELPGAAVTSELTLAEVLPKAPSFEHRRLYFQLMLWSGIFDLRPVTREILVETADYRRVAATMRPDGTRGHAEASGCHPCRHRDPQRMQAISFNGRWNKGFGRHGVDRSGWCRTRRLDGRAS